MERLSTYLTTHPRMLFLVVVLALVLLPVAIWLDLVALSHRNLSQQASTLNGIVNGFRGYYTTQVIARVREADGAVQMLHNYRDVKGAIPVPATLSIELGDMVAQAQADVGYRFVSDYPFRGRPAHDLTRFETGALAQFRSGPGAPASLVQETGDLLNHALTLATPVVMGPACVACHNSHPDSPKQDWKTGDVRGLQLVSVTQPVTLGLWSFKFVLTYLGLAGSFGFLFATAQLRLAARFRRLNQELAANNDFLADVSLKISKYLPPQIYRSIFAGEKDAEISTERKKLTVFFSDIKDFTATTEMMQPEELTALLNEYFTEMVQIAESHGATIDKFIGDAIVAFFGDPTSRGTAEDARACLHMALDMQRRLRDLEQVWHARGIERPFRARMGINTGYCNVGNFGSRDRLNYTIIGAEANLAARLESIAQPGGIVMSYETYAHVRDVVAARRLTPVHLKGISREIIPYEVIAPETEAETGARLELPAEDGRLVRIDTARLDPDTRARLRAALRD